MIRKAIAYLKYYLQSTTAHGVHSPFVYELITQVIYNETPFYAYQKVGGIRSALSKNQKEVEIVDLGAGSSFGLGNKRSISKILNTSVKSEKYARLIFRLADKHQPKTVYELGTSLGLTTLYLSYACPDAKIISIEGDKSISRMAKSLFKRLRRNNIEQVEGSFEKTLPELLEKEDEVDFVFIDGHHDKEATLKYFGLFLNKSTENSVFIFDDIRWSKGMQEAWEEIKKHEKVSLSIDLFEMGIVYFKARHQKEDFVVRF